VWAALLITGILKVHLQNDRIGLLNKRSLEPVRRQFCEGRYVIFEKVQGKRRFQLKSPLKWAAGSGAPTSRSIHNPPRSEGRPTVGKKPPTQTRQVRQDNQSESGKTRLDRCESKIQDVLAYNAVRRTYGIGKAPRTSAGPSLRPRIWKIKE
jgi:hypothetical protein